MRRMIYLIFSGEKNKINLLLTAYEITFYQNFGMINSINDMNNCEDVRSLDNAVCFRKLKLKGNYKLMIYCGLKVHRSR